MSGNIKLNENDKAVRKDERFSESMNNYFIHKQKFKFIIKIEQ